MATTSSMIGTSFHTGSTIHLTTLVVIAAVTALLGAGADTSATRTKCCNCLAVFHTNMHVHGEDVLVMTMRRVGLPIASIVQ